MIIADEPTIIAQAAASPRGAGAEELGPLVETAATLRHLAESARVVLSHARQWVG